MIFCLRLVLRNLVNPEPLNDYKISNWENPVYELKITLKGIWPKDCIKVHGELAGFYILLLLLL